MLTALVINYFLLAISWAVINSIWQGLVVYLIYRIACGYKSSALFRYNLGLASLLIVFVLFICEIFLGYTALSKPGMMETSEAFWQIQQAAFIRDFPVFFQFIAGGYLLACFINSSKLVYKLFKMTQLTSLHQKAPIDIRLFTNKTALHLGIKKNVAICISKNIEIPCVSGFLKPIILLPFTLFNHLTTEQAEAIIIHELAHIKRNDYIINIFQSLIDVLLFVNPFAILLSNNVRKERENCCDDWVVTYRYNKQLYASALLELAQNRQQNFQLLPAATGKKGYLLHRIKRLFSETPVTDITPMQKLRLAGTSLTLLIMLLISMPAIIATTGNGTENIDNSLSIAFKSGKSQTYLETQNQLVTDNDVHSETLPKFTNEVKKEQAVKTKHNKVKPRKGDEKGYTIALINNELLDENVAATTINTNVSLHQTIADSSNKNYIVKVEIEQSGSANTTSYLLEYNKNSDGTADLKPLIITTKKMSSTSSSSARKVKHSSGKSSPKSNKRITL